MLERERERAFRQVATCLIYGLHFNWKVVAAAFVGCETRAKCIDIDECFFQVDGWSG